MQDDLTRTIAADLGLNNLPAEEQRGLIAQFGEVALKAATSAVLGKLSVDKQEEFATIAGTGDSGALQTFLNREVPGHEEIAKAAVTDEIKRFKEFQAKDAGAGDVA
jgi:hypothetical protein